MPRSGLTIQAEISGLQPLLHRLEVIAARPRRLILREAVKQGAAPILAIARARVPVDSGLLRRSLWSKIKVKRGTALALIGARTHQEKEVRRHDRHKLVKESPSAIAHLVEGGAHRARHGSVKARRFMARAAKQGLPEAQRIMAEVIRSGLENV